MPEQHAIPVTVASELPEDVQTDLHEMPINVYHTDRYLVVDAGLPRCLPDRIHVFIEPSGQLLIRGERHAGEPVKEERTYLLNELPDGKIGRMLDLPGGDWAFDDAEAHFANGLLTVSIPTQERAAYLRQMHNG
jgi:HSP20 family molecular chaperone IbpA